MGFIFVTYAGDHPPYHVHILNENGRNLGRFDIEHQQPMDNFKITKRLAKALIHLGYMKKGAGK